MVHCFPSIMAFATHMLYKFNLKPISCNVDEYNSYHNNADCTHPYNALSSFTYITFFPFTSVINSFKDGSISQNNSASLPVIFMNTSSFILAFKYAPLTSVIALSLPSFASMSAVIKKASCDTVGDAVSSFVYKFR